ncbi:MAG: ABC transporter substrate-binding protein [Euryarchaeota archaeon]|nr:ABC transporter substrate-binding protein [Euryarchaeota archaeon]|tara:strand:+ start:626 stop:1477 length:852 start_codon:yes stop_codon:yes gene_type:complete
MTRVRIGHSPDPDDAFMFYALTSGVLDTPGIDYEHVLVDIDTLNMEAKEGTYEVSAVSIRSFPEISEAYALMNCGASMGEGYGPIVVSKRQMSLEEATRVEIAVPGTSTSSYLALRLAMGDVTVKEVPFDDILPGVLDGRYDAGVIIHEGQLTWLDEGANLVLDLGVWWNDETGLPLPLGGNVVRRDLGDDLCNQISNDIRRSIEYAISNPELALEFSRQWGRGIDEHTNEKFVKMYVNERTVDYGEEGRIAVRLFLSRGKEIGLINPDFDEQGIDFIGENDG